MKVSVWILIWATELRGSYGGLMSVLKRKGDVHAVLHRNQHQKSTSKYIAHQSHNGHDSFRNQLLSGTPHHLHNAPECTKISNTHRPIMGATTIICSGQLIPSSSTLTFEGKNSWLTFTFFSDASIVRHVKSGIQLHTRRSGRFSINNP